MINEESPMRGPKNRRCRTAKRNASAVVILAAWDFTGEPLAVVELPVRTPFGFHGDRIADQD